MHFVLKKYYIFLDKIIVFNNVALNNNIYYNHYFDFNSCAQVTLFPLPVKSFGFSIPFVAPALNMDTRSISKKRKVGEFL